MRILHFDHAAHYRRDADAIDAAIRGVLAAGTPIMGPEVAAFERAFADLAGARHATAVMSGSAALQLALSSLELEPGDEVITAANGDIPATHAIHHAGGRVVWAEIDPATYNLDPAAFEAAITPRTRAVLPVHLYGVPADMEPIAALAARHGLAVIEDAALATGATYRGRPVGALGTAAAFSTAPGKVLGGIASGGVITTDHDALHQRIGRLRHYGRAASPYPDPAADPVRWPSDTVAVGFNERMNTVDAAVLLVRLERLADDIAVRRRHHARYARRFAGTGVVMQRAPEGADPVWRVVVIRVPERDRIYAELRRSGIEATLPYLPANHLDVCYRHLGYRRGSLPRTETFCDEMIALPCHPYLSDEQIDEVASRVLELL